jgi:hypothetical protein
MNRAHLTAATVSRPTLIAMLGAEARFASNDEEAAEGVATREWPMPPVKPFRVIHEQAQAEARDAAEKLGAIYRAADAAKGNGNG